MIVKIVFDLNGREKTRWTAKNGAGLDFSIDEVLAVTRGYTFIHQHLTKTSLFSTTSWIPTTLLHFLFFDILQGAKAQWAVLA